MTREEIKERLSELLPGFSLITENNGDEAYSLGLKKNTGLVLFRDDYMRFIVGKAQAFFRYDQIRDIKRGGGSIVIKTAWGYMEILIPTGQVIYFPDGVVLRHRLPEADVSRFFKQQQKSVKA